MADGWVSGQTGCAQTVHSGSPAVGSQPRMVGYGLVIGRGHGDIQGTALVVLTMASTDGMCHYWVMCARWVDTVLVRTVCTHW